MTRVNQIVRDIDSLPPFPEVVRRVIELAEDPSASAEDIFQVVQYDQAVTANCLRLCNCSYFGLRQKVESLQQALILLGTKNLLKILLASGGLKIYSKGQKGYGLQRGDLWRHSVTCAIIAELVLKWMGRAEDPLIFTASLLHDVGKIVLSAYVSQDFEKIILLVRENRLSFVEAEQRVLGINHAELGGMIAETWQFPIQLVNAIRYHHQPEHAMIDDGSMELVPLVRLSNLIANMLGVGTGHDGMACRVDSELLSQFGLGRKDVQGIMVTFPSEMKKAEDLLNIMFS